MSLRIGSSEESSEFSEENLSDQDSGTDVSRRDSEHTDDSTLWGSEEHGLWASSKQYESPTTITARGVEFDIVNRRGESENSSSKTSSPTSSQSSSESGAAFARRVQQSVTAKGKVSLPSSQRPANPGPGPAKAGLDKEQEADVEIPNINCAKCTLQVIEFMAEHGLNKDGDFSYHHCATLKITANPKMAIDKGWPG